jgi:probable rRNA maturation factor
MIFIELEASQEFPPEPLQRAAEAALAFSGAVEADLTIVLTDDQHIQGLNQEYLDHDAPTDVLSFPAGETDPETGRAYLGDVIISLPQATRQAQERGHPLEAEMQLLAVHGVLHLLGHDHADEPEKAAMWAAQATILESLGLSPNIVHE